MFKVKYMYVDSIMMLVRLDLNLIVSIFQHKCEVSETVSTTTLLRCIVFGHEILLPTFNSFTQVTKSAIYEYTQNVSLPYYNFFC